MTTIADSKAAEINFTIYRGEDFVLPLEFQQDNGLPVNLTGSSAIAELRRHFTTKVADFGVAIADPPTGEIQISLPRSIVNSLPPATYSWRLFLVDSLGQQSPRCRGTVLVVDL